MPPVTATRRPLRSVDCMSACSDVRTLVVLQVKVNLKSSENCALVRHGIDADHQRGGAAQRRGVVGLRFYEERGLIASERAGSGHRRYPRSVLRRVAFIVFAQRIGLTLDEIGAELAKLPSDRDPDARATGRGSRARGRSGSTSGSPSSAAQGRASPSASAAAVCPSIGAAWPTRPIARGARARGRATGWANLLSRINPQRFPTRQAAAVPWPTWIRTGDDVSYPSSSLMSFCASR